MFKKTLTFLLCLLLAVPTLPQALLQHPWQGKCVAYFGDSITDPRNKAAKKKYWGFLNDWLQMTPYVYGVSGRQWNDVPRQADLCWAEHGDSIDVALNDVIVDSPLLWWPNGSGEQNLYTCRFDVVKGTQVIDTKTTTFGIRQYDYRKENTAMVSVSRMTPIFSTLSSCWKRILPSR